MPGKPKGLAQVRRGIRTIGLAGSLRAALYPLRRRYNQARYAAQGDSPSTLRGISGLLRGRSAVKLVRPPPETC